MPLLIISTPLANVFNDLDIADESHVLLVKHT